MVLPTWSDRAAGDGLTDCIESKVARPGDRRDGVDAETGGKCIAKRPAASRRKDGALECFWSRFEFAWRHLRHDAPEMVSVAVRRIEQRIGKQGKQVLLSPPGVESVRTSYQEQAVEEATDLALGRPCSASALGRAVDSNAAAKKANEDKLKLLESLVEQCLKGLADLTRDIRTLEGQVVKTAVQAVEEDTNIEQRGNRQGESETGQQTRWEVTNPAPARPCPAVALGQALQSTPPYALPKRSLKAHLSDESTRAPTCGSDVGSVEGPKVKRPGRRARARAHREHFEARRSTFGSDGERHGGLTLSANALCSLLETEEDCHEMGWERQSSVSDPDSSGDSEGSGTSERTPQKEGPVQKLFGTGQVQVEVGRSEDDLAIHCRLEPQIGGKANPNAHRDRHVLMGLSLEEGECEMRRSATDQADFVLEFMSCTTELLQHQGIACGAWGMEVMWMYSHNKKQLDNLEASEGGHFPTLIKEGRKINDRMLELAKVVDGHGFLKDCSPGELATQQSLRDCAIPWQRLQLALCRAVKWVDANPEAEGELEGLAELLMPPREGKFAGTSDAELQAMLQKRLASSRRA